MIQINQNEIHVDFKKHIDIVDNKRILFTAPFGTGKSTMLENFFNENTQDYFVCKLLPINYSVASNEDVFELIKYDLLTYLMANFYDELNLEKEDFSLLLRSQMFIMERLKVMPLLSAILGMNEKIGQPVVKLLEAMESVIKDFKAFSKEIKIDEEDDIEKFIASIKHTKGNIYEMDAVSRLINDLLQRVNSGRGNSKSVLVVDDLDRLDPEHIFRLFNIFCSHDDTKGINKFGFDKVIFVCDIENIRKIYHHKYGFEVDFLGYIDKFYSIRPFEFDNRTYVRESIVAYVSKIKFGTNFPKFYQIEKGHRLFETLTAIFLSLLEAKILNLRILNREIVYDEYPTYRENSKLHKVNNFPMLVIFNLLKILFGSSEVTKSKLKYLYEYYDGDNYSNNSDIQHYSYENLQDLVFFCLPFLMKMPNSSVKQKENGTKILFSEKYKCYIQFSNFSEGNMIFFHFYKATLHDADDSEEYIFNAYQLLYDVFEFCLQKNYLR
ncbi:P-loop NTPase fold protein [Flavobacterium sp. RHBU_3]|uniref:P-loop NTPase fold protein n=1 Tax=Flavobacterium sp. RHBU_3 TaxID=3391184 RepID=UPI0039854975